jgi:VWFA-related protein
MRARRAAAVSTLLVLTSTALVAVQQNDPDIAHPLRVDVRLVNIYATVIDSNGRYVAGLKRNDFLVEEDGKRQTLSYVDQNQDTPVSIGIVLDTSGSMRSKLDTATEAIDRFVRTIQPDDDIFLMSFDSDTYLLQDFTSDRAKLRKGLRYAESEGRTALYDALEAALKKIKSGANQKRAILLITDGEDTASHASFEEIRERIRESTPVYPLGITATRDFVGRDVDMNVLKAFTSDSERNGRVSEDMLGGRNSRFDEILGSIAEELRNQFTRVLSQPSDDGAFHRVRDTRYGYNIRARGGTSRRLNKDRVRLRIVRGLPK